MARQKGEAGLPAAMEVWQVEDRGISVEYSLAVMNEIRSKVLDASRRIGRGGLETGGVLFGLKEPDAVRILAWRPMPCSHQRGPSLILSPDDETELGHLLARYSKDPSLAALTPVGWFRSRTRGEICLNAEDLALHNRFFAEIWQVALVIRPGQDDSTRAGFFFREAGGEIRSESSYKEFEIEDFPGRYAAFENNVQQPVADERPAAPRVEPPPSLTTPPVTRPSIWWTLLWIAACALAGFVGVFIERERARSLEPQLTLRVRDNGGQLQADWTVHDPSLAGSAQGKLVVSDGPSTTEIVLDRPALQRGHATFARRSEQVKVRLVVHKAGSSPLEETALFVGRPVEEKPAAGSAETIDKLERLERENLRLQEELKREGARAEQLKQQYYRVLQERIQDQRQSK